jgi:hypothetical protein
MQTSFPLENPELTRRAEAERIATAMAGFAVRWASQLSASVRRISPAISEALATEIRAYCLCRLQMALRGAPNGHEFWKTVCVAAHRRQPRGGSHAAARSLPFGNEAADPAGFSEGYLRLAGDGPAASRVTRQMFSQFCSCTGLSGDVLVGKDENLASIIFYICVHAVLSARGALTREEVRVLLRASHACRDALELELGEWTAQGAWHTREAVSDPNVVSPNSPHPCPLPKWGEGAASAAS